MAQNPAINSGERWTFNPDSHTMGWTTERQRSLQFKHQNASPQDFRGRSVIIIDYSGIEETYQVYFDGDTPSDYFYCCEEFLTAIPAKCSCSGYDLFHFGCRCGLASSSP